MTRSSLWRQKLPCRPCYPLVRSVCPKPGAYQWHTFFGLIGNDVGSAITSDGRGNIYVAGDSAGTWNGPGNCSALGVSPCPLHAHAGTDNNATDIVVIKLNSAGAYQWHTFYGSSGWDEGYAITNDASGICVTGDSRTSWNGPGSILPQNPHGDYPGLIDRPVDTVVVKLAVEVVPPHYYASTCR